MMLYPGHLQNCLDYGHGLVIFIILALFWLSGKGKDLGFPGISRATYGGNGLKFCMLMDPDHLQNWLGCNHGQLISLILVLFWLSENGHIWGLRAFPGEPVEEMAWNFAFWCIFIAFRNGLIMVTVCWYFLILELFWLHERGQICGFWAISGECVGVNVEGGSGGIFPTRVLSSL